MNLSAYVLRRLFLAAIVVFFALFVIFFISHVLPANPAKTWAGTQSTEEQVEKIREEYHLDEPVYLQFFYFLGDLAHGDLGRSPVTGRPVLEDLQRFGPATFELVITSFLIGGLVGVPLGVVSAVKKGTIVDELSRVLAVSGISIPVFWLGIIMQLIFYYNLQWLPANGRIGAYMAPPQSVTGFYILDSIISRNFVALKSSIVHLILPGLTLSVFSLARITRITRSSMLEVLSKDYIDTGRAKGLPETVVIYKHALKNAFSSTLTMFGLIIAYTLGGTVVVETVFAWPGLGRYAAASLRSFDFPALMGFTLLIAVIIASVNLLIDVSYGFLDPRIRES